MHDSVVHLSAIPLAKSPFVSLPAAVTLPFDYAPLPPSLEHIPRTDFSSAERIHEYCSSSLQVLAETREKHAKMVHHWQKDVDTRELEKKRRIAPGYLDSEQRLLQPSRSEQ